MGVRGIISAAAMDATAKRTITLFSNMEVMCVREGNRSIGGIQGVQDRKEMAFLYSAVSLYPRMIFLGCCCTQARGVMKFHAPYTQSPPGTSGTFQTHTTDGLDESLPVVCGLM
jgi:hypothetical protein